MYLEHFALRELPFSITPDTSYFFNNTGHQEAMNVLLVALRSGEGFIKISGEVGTGKTLLCRRLLNLLSVDKHFVTAYIPNPYLSPAALTMALAEELDIDCPRDIGQHRALKLITDHLIALTAKGKRVVLMIDEAQAMPEQSLEALRLLTNLETEKYKLLQIVLFGQPELDNILAKPSVRQFRQRIAFSYTLPSMDCEGVKAYVAHRLVVAGYGGAPMFADKAMNVLCRASRGVPRLVNIIAHKALMAAYGQGARTIQVQHVRAAVADTEDANLYSRKRIGWPRYVWLGMAVSAIASGAWFFLRVAQ
ncbi:ExeA family protein [Sulfuriflexus mobilis]|uniref:ExeA family protein n=1 Tax=Sulfuriflexus mobilis TaxID=1811807 RepID=UPI000F8405BA|nr:AAA family ATPase [Sulfuriflexus mobilis]